MPGSDPTFDAIDFETPEHATAATGDVRVISGDMWFRNLVLSIRIAIFLCFGLFQALELARATGTAVPVSRKFKSRTRRYWHDHTDHCKGFRSRDNQLPLDFGTRPEHFEHFPCVFIHFQVLELARVTGTAVPVSRKFKSRTRRY